MFGIKTRIKRYIAKCIAATFSSPRKKPIEKLALHKKYKLQVPTYEKSGQAVHPDILVQKSPDRYILTFTPYPNANDRFENPSIVISDDGLRFFEEQEGLNPLVDAPIKDHNDDPDISLRDGIYSIVYLETVRPDYQNLMLLTSTDRIHWKKQILSHEDFTSSNHIFLLSPAVVFDTVNCFLFFVEKQNNRDNALSAVQGSDLQSLDFSKKQVLRLHGLPVNLQPWHVDVFKDDKNGYVMLLCMVSRSPQRKKYSLFIATSENLTDWTFQAHPVLRNCYRSSGFVKNNTLYIYFSSNVLGDVWKIGLYKTALPNLA